MGERRGPRNGRADVSVGRLLAALGGAALIALVAWLGARPIGAELWLAAWTVPLCLAIHAGQLALSALAWRTVSGRPPPGFSGWWRARWIREAVNSMLPVAQLGGNLVGARLLAVRGAGQVPAAAGTVLDLTIEAAAQAAFALIGIGVLAAAVPGRHEVAWIAGGAAGLCLAIAGLVAAQRLGLLCLLEATAARAGRHLAGLDLRGLEAEFARLCRRRRRLAEGAGLHLLAWLLGVGETALVLAATGSWPGAAAALAIESLGMAARSAGFAVPGALGVQEAGFVLVAGLFGVPAEIAVALSMVKRARELLVGAAGLLAWQGSEGLWRRAQRPAPVAAVPAGQRRPRHDRDPHSNWRSLGPALYRPDQT